MAFDTDLGWRPRANINAHYLASRDDIFHLITDGDGWPGTRPLESCPVVVIGDSFAFGYGVDAGASFAELNPKLAVKAFGAPGYSMVHGVRFIEQLGSRLTGKLVIWFICLENDLEDNLAPAMAGYRSPFVRRSRANGGWEIVDTHVKPEPWRAVDHGWKRMFPNLCVPGQVADHAYAASDYLIGRASAACRNIGASLVVVTIPDPTQLTTAGREALAAASSRPDACDAGLPDRRLAESCAQHGVAMVAGMNHLSYRHYKRREGLHWNASGHRQMAGVIAQIYDSFRAGDLEKLTAQAPKASPGLRTLHQSPAGAQ